MSLLFLVQVEQPKKRTKKNRTNDKILLWRGERRRKENY
jgi:hypothetical protein